MKLSNLMEIIEELAPKSLAETWDNVGLLVGNRHMEVTGAVLCLDVTEDAYQMCINKKAQVCISHHPFLFEPTKRMDFADPYYDLLRKFIQSDIALYSAHTNLDACVGGVNDALGRALGLEIKATFLPDGVPFDIEKGVVSGIGRIGIPRKETRLFELFSSIIHDLQTSGCHINFDCDRPVHKILLLGGSYDSEWNPDVLDNEIDVVVSGEIKHRDMIYFNRYGIAAIAAGHDATERCVLPVFAEYLNTSATGLDVHICPSSQNKPISTNS
jgi:dinuclear metal center YbgI/SA1388 family protein